MAGLTFRPALPGDHLELERLMRATAMGGSVRIQFERDPDFFVGAQVQADEPCVWGVFDESQRAVATFAAGHRKIFLNAPERMRYLSDLRVHPEYRRASLLGRGFRVLRKEIFQKGEWAQTLVLEDNVAALDLLCSGRAGLPRYQPAGRYMTWLMPHQRVDRLPGITIRRATVHDIDGMQDLYDASALRRSFSSRLDFACLDSPHWRDLGIGDFLIAEAKGQLLGMAGLWNQSGFQRMRIQGYARKVAMLRPWWNRMADVPLPGAGQVLEICKITALACKDDEPWILRSLLGVALAENRGRLLLLGLSGQDPLLPALRGLKARVDFGRHFLVGWEGEPPPWKEPFGFDVARI